VVFVANTQDRTTISVGYNLDVAKHTKIEPAQPSLFEMGDPQNTVSNEIQVERPYYEPGLMLGTSSFTATGWSGTFYPAGMKSADYLTYYATRFKTVEIDSTYYGPPSSTTVMRWRDKTPPDFIFAAKIPQAITHEKKLVGCESEFNEFFETMSILGDKLGPLVFQFPHFDRWIFPKQEDFLSVLRPFLQQLPSHEFAIEIRNKTWLNAVLLDLLREHKVALVLQDLSSMPRPWELKGDLNLITGDFAYVRWLGDRHGIEMTTKVWDKTVVDRGEDLRSWAGFLKSLVLNKRLRKIFAFANNHYAGHGPATVKQFWELWNKR